MALKKRYLGFKVLVLLGSNKPTELEGVKGEAEKKMPVGQLTVSFLPMVLLWERERVMLKKESFLVAESGGDEVLTSLPLDGGNGGEAVD